MRSILDLWTHCLLNEINDEHGIKVMLIYFVTITPQKNLI